MKVGDKVRYINPFEDEKDLTFTIIEISVIENWAIIQANLNLSINPTYTANLTDLETI